MISVSHRDDARGVFVTYKHRPYDAGQIASRILILSFWLKNDKKAEQSREKKTYERQKKSGMEKTERDPEGEEEKEGGEKEYNLYLTGIFLIAKWGI